MSSRNMSSSYNSRVNVGDMVGGDIASNGNNHSQLGEQTHVPVTEMANGTAPNSSRNDILESSGSETDDEDEVSLEDEGDVENITVVSLLDDAKFNDVSAMLAHLKTSFDFDLASVQKRLGEATSSFCYFYLKICVELFSEQVERCL